MNDIIKFCSDLESLPSQSGKSIFDISHRHNACIKEKNQAIVTLIENNIEFKEPLKCLDLFCGHGYALDEIQRKFQNSVTIGVDINDFRNDWNYFKKTIFFQKDVFDVIQIKPDFKFDVIITLNTLRANSSMWGEENLERFLTWCTTHSNYLITNNCTNKEFEGFQLIDTVGIEGLYDTNLFKSNNSI